MRPFALTHTLQARHHSFGRARLTFSIAMSEIEQRYVIKFLYTKRFALDRTAAELALVDGEGADAK
jgi:hypothetical protein